MNTYFSSDEEHHYQGNEEEELKLHDGRGSNPIQESNVRCTVWQMADTTLKMCVSTQTFESLGQSGIRF